MLDKRKKKLAAPPKKKALKFSSFEKQKEMGWEGMRIRWSEYKRMNTAIRQMKKVPSSCTEIG